MATLLLFNKPFRVLSQFTSEGDKATLADYVSVKDVYAAGRLDYDSEGLLLLTDNGSLQHQIANPSQKMEKTYWAQVEGNISQQALQQLARGVELKDGLTKPAKAIRIDPPAGLWPRNPPIRERANIPTSWVELKIKEGKNRQVRRMTAAVGFPTLRLIRAAVGQWSLEDIPVGEYQTLSVEAPRHKPTPKRAHQKPQQKQPQGKNTGKRSAAQPHRPTKQGTSSRKPKR